MKQPVLSRRRFLQLTAGVTVSSALAACIAPAAPAADTGDAGMETTTIDVWAYPRTENDGDIVYAPLNEGFHAAHPDIMVQVEVQPWGGRREKLYAAAAAGEAPDIWDATTDTVPAYITKGVILGLDDLLTADDLADYHAAEIDAASLD
ncbi:MAG: extracellular solute-binding protein, partial [Caldilineaceae bacterium]|nr:extracellular solute-binding protein [Caldilineaceae bacterium]